MLKNHRFATADHSIIQAEDEAGNRLNIPVSDRNAHYRELVLPFLAGDAKNGVPPGAIADFTPDTASAAAAKRAELKERLLDELLTGSRPVEELRAALKAEMPAAEPAPVVEAKP